MSGVLTPVLMYFMLLGLIVSTAVPTFGKIHGSLGEQFLRVGQALVGGTTEVSYDPRGATEALLREIAPVRRSPLRLQPYDDETVETPRPTELEWDALQGHFTRVGQLGGTLASRLAGDQG